MSISAKCKLKVLVPDAHLTERSIQTIRGHRVMVDSDLAGLYQVETSNLNKAVKRNIERFPVDFMFQLSTKEWDTLIFQTGISKPSRGGRRSAPYVFTEQGVAMHSSVLNSKRAVQVNIVIMRTFVKLREMVGAHKELAQKVVALEQKYQQHDDELNAVFTAIKQLLKPPPSSAISQKKKIGFRTDDEK